MTIILKKIVHTVCWVMKMRIQIVEPQNKIQCGICKAEGDWIKRVNVRGIQALYCIKCDTVTMFNKMPSKFVYKALKNEVEDIRLHYYLNQDDKVK